MKLCKKKLLRFLSKKDEWLKWVYSENENHFFWFCPVHIGAVARPTLDGIGDHREPNRVCDYPGCTLKADKELFPNLIRQIKDRTKGPFVTWKEFNEKFNAKRKRARDRGQKTP